MGYCGNLYDMYNREFPGGSFLFFISCKMSLFRLPRQARVCAATKASVKYHSKVSSASTSARMVSDWPYAMGAIRMFL